MQRRARLLKNRSRHRGNHRSAMAASIRRATSDAVMLPLDSALFTVSYAAGETLFFKVLKASVIVGKLAVKIVDRVP